MKRIQYVENNKFGVLKFLLFLLGIFQLGLKTKGLSYSNWNNHFIYRVKKGTLQCIIISFKVNLSGQNTGTQTILNSNEVKEKNITLSQIHFQE